MATTGQKTTTSSKVNLEFIWCPKCFYHTAHTAVDLVKGLVRCACGCQHEIRLKESK